MSDDPDAVQHFLKPRGKLAPYAGAEPPRQRLRQLDRTRRAEALAAILRQQQDGSLLSEIGADMHQPCEVVRALIIAWLWRLGENAPADRA